MNSKEQYPFIFQNDFLLGFEVEACFKERKITILVLKRRLLKICSGIIFSDDGSIRPRNGCDFSAEIKTPPLKAVEACVVLDKVLSLVKEFGYTNSSTGFHVNLSPVSNEVYKKINPFFLARHRLFAKIAKKFKREKNDYCKPSSPAAFKFKQKTALKLWEYIRSNRYMHVQERATDYFFSGNSSTAFGEKSVAINLNNLTPIRNATSRIEIRAMGNRNYHLRLPEIFYYIDQTIKVIKESTTVNLGEVFA